MNNVMNTVMYDDNTVYTYHLIWLLMILVMLKLCARVHYDQAVRSQLGYHQGDAC